MTSFFKSSTEPQLIITLSARAIDSPIPTGSSLLSLPSNDSKLAGESARALACKNLNLRSGEAWIETSTAFPNFLNSRYSFTFLIPSMRTKFDFDSLSILCLHRRAIATGPPLCLN